MPRIWPFDTGVSEDTFATPSQPATGEIDPQSLLGPEPAVFGGVNPQTPEEQSAAANAAAAAEVASEPLGTTLDEPIRGNELLGEGPIVNWARVLRSTWFLLGSMIVCLVSSTFLVRMAVPTETYVQTSVKFVNYDKLNELEALDLQRELAKLLQTFPMRAEAWELLQKRSPGVPPGFLNSGLIFHRFDAITWDPRGIIQLRIDSSDPSTDITRLSAVTEVFYRQLARRAARLDDFKTSLAAQEELYAQNLQRDAQLKSQIDALLPDAQRYMDLKQAMQSMERYLELADESAPLRLVARQNLRRLASQVNGARELSVQRDELLDQRVTLQKDNDAVAQEIGRLKRAIDVFVFPEPTNADSLKIHDTRDHQKLVMRSTWVGVILLFAGIIAAIHFADNRAAERYRRERRELLKLQSRQAKAEAEAAEAGKQQA